MSRTKIEIQSDFDDSGNYTYVVEKSRGRLTFERRFKLDIKNITENDLLKLPVTQAIVAEIEDYFTDYLFYKNDGEKALFQCTRCGCSDRIEKNFKHKEVINCPVCCEEVITYRAGYGRKYLYEERSFGVCYNLSGLLAIRIVTVDKNFPPTPIEWYTEEKIIPEYDYSDDYIYIFSNKKAVRFINHPKLIDNKWVRNYKKASRFALLPQYWGLNSPTNYDTAVLINTNAIKNTCLKYSEVSEIAENVNYALKYLKFFQKHPNVEYLIKQGFLPIVFECIIYNDSAEKIEWKSNNLLHMLGISKTDIEFCSEMRIYELEFYKAVLKTDQKNAKDIYLYFKNYNVFTDILNIQKITAFTFNKIRNYILKQQKNNGGSINHIIRTWLDYLRMGDDREILEEITPKNIYDAHDRMNEKCKYLASVKENEKISGRVESLKPLIFNFENLIMKIPKSGQEIINEGKILQHCVGGYVSQHANGSTTILFIRHKDNPGKPFFTIEIDNDLKIVQCHGFRNERGSAKPQEILDFEVNYKKYLMEVKQNGKFDNKRTGS